jgi:hypothetical protein
MENLDRENVALRLTVERTSTGKSAVQPQRSKTGQSPTEVLMAQFA